MEVGATDGAASNLEDDIAGLDDLGLGAVNDLDCVLALPDQSLHHLAGVAILCSVSCRVGNVLGGDGVVAVANGLLSQGCCL